MEGVQIDILLSVTGQEEEEVEWLQVVLQSDVYQKRMGNKWLHTLKSIDVHKKEICMLVMPTLICMVLHFMANSAQPG